MMIRHLRNKALPLALATLTLAGCATREKYENYLQGWIGANISTVITAWGYPSGSLEDPTSGNLVYVWDRQSSYTSAPTYQTSVIMGRHGGGYATTFGFPGQTYVYRCQTYFEVDKNKNILKWRTQGNDCRM